MNTETLPNAHLLTPCGTNYTVPAREPHTPGPWKAVKNEAKRGFDIWGQHTSESAFLAEVCGDMVIGPENAANAQLIAAAPDLLEALKVAAVLLRPIVHKMNIRSHFHEHNMLANVIEKAIAKAEGVEA